MAIPGASAGADPMYEAFDRLCECDAAEWGALVAREFPGAPSLQAELLQLLQAHAEGTASVPDGRTLRTLMGAALARAGDGLDIGHRVGRWEIVGEVGQGGMGTVYRVCSTDAEVPLTAALKLGERADAKAQSRLAAEGRILASLSHPNIARLLDSGVAHGRRYFVMELVEGEHIDRAAARMDLSARVLLLRQVGEALVHAHARLVVHRDLKPHNVLVEQVDGSARVRLLDFGIARSLEVDQARTATGAIALTLRYAAPEQLLGDPPTAAVDVHGLGLLAYEVLTGRHPFEDAGPGELVGALLERRPPPMGVSARQAGLPAHHVAGLRGDLEAIVQRALRKEPAARYGSMQAFIDDLDAWREGRPVQARAGGTSYRVWRLLRRHWLASGGIAASMLAMLALSAFAFERAQRAEQARAEAEQVAAFLPALLRGLDPMSQRGGSADLRVSDFLEEAAATLEHSAYPDGARAAMLHSLAEGFIGLGEPARALELARQAEPLARTPQLQLDSLLLRADALQGFDLRAAERLLGQAHAAAERVDAEGARARVQVAHGRLLAAAGSAREAEARLSDAVGSLEALRAAGGAHAGLGAVLGLLSVVQMELGRLEVALRNSERALAITAEDFGSSHPAYAARLSGHAQVLEAFGRSDDALRIQGEAVQILELRLGPTSTATLAARANRALVLARQKRLEEAAIELTEVVRGFEAQPGGPSLNAADQRQNLAAILLRMGRLDDARAAAEGALQIYDAQLPASSYLPAYPRITLAGIAVDQQRPDDAQRLALEAIERLDATRGPGSLAAVVARGRLGQALRAKGDCEAGAALLRAALGALDGMASSAVAAQRAPLAAALEQACHEP